MSQTLSASTLLAVLDELGIEDLAYIGVSKGPDRNAGREIFHFPDGRELTLPLDAPVPLKSEDPVWLAAIDEGMVSIGHYAPDALLVSLGFDPFKGDPSADLAVSTEGFRAAGERIGAYGGPVVLVQEGGYLVEKLSDNLDAFLDGFMRARAVSTRSAP